MIGSISLSHPAFNYKYKGFCSIVNQVIDIAYEHNLDHKNYDVLIQDTQLKEIFDFREKKQCDYDASKVWLNKFFSGNLNYSCNAHTELDIEFLIERKKVFNSVMKIKKEIIEEAEQALEMIDQSKTLAVHDVRIRL